VTLDRKAAARTVNNTELGVHKSNKSADGDFFEMGKKYNNLILGRIKS